MPSVKLAGNDGFLLVAAGHTACGGCCPLTASDVVLLYKSVGIAAYCVEFYKAAALKILFKIALEHHILSQRIVKDKSVLMPVLRYMADTVGVFIAYAFAGHILAGKLYTALIGFIKPGQCLYKLRLTVAVNTCDTHYFAAAHIEGDLMYGVALMKLAFYAEVFYGQHRLARCGRVFIHHKAYISAHHHSGQLLHVCILYINRAYVFALAQYGAAVRYLHDFVQLMCYEQYGFALSGKSFHYFHKLADLLGGQHSSRLVENKYLVVAVQHFQYFRSLLHTYRYILDKGVGVYIKSVGL